MKPNSAQQLNPAQQEVLEALRGDRLDRPSIDKNLRFELQHELESQLRDIEGPLTIDKSALNKVHQCEGRYLAVSEFQWTPANAQGTIAHKAIEISGLVTQPVFEHNANPNQQKQVTPARLVEAAINRICENSDTQSLATYIKECSPEELAELRNHTTDTLIKFTEMFPPISHSWFPNAESTTAAYIGQRRVVFRGKIDLKLGQPIGDKAGTVIIDIKTGNPTFSDMEDLRFYALLETLRTGLPPFRWANAYVSAGRIETENFSEGALWSAAKRLADGVRKIAEITSGREPNLTPGNACRFCPLKSSCESSEKYQANLILSSKPHPIG